MYVIWSLYTPHVAGLKTATEPNCKYVCVCVCVYVCMYICMYVIWPEPCNIAKL